MGEINWSGYKFSSFKQPLFYYIESFDSSAGRAEDCRVMWLSLGRWFNSGSKEFFYFLFFIHLFIFYFTCFSLIISIFPIHFILLLYILVTSLLHPFTPYLLIKYGLKYFRRLWNSGFRIEKLKEIENHWVTCWFIFVHRMIKMEVIL